MVIYGVLGVWKCGLNLIWWKNGGAGRSMFERCL